MASVFDFTSYKNFVEAWLAEQPRKGHGLRRKIAETIGTQTGFITQVLSGPLNFGPEQALAVAGFFGLGPEEREFFLLLVQKERAGTEDYRRYVDGQIRKILEDRKNLTKRIKAGEFPSEVDHLRYFSSWLYACVHVMTTCEKYRHSRIEMAEALGLPLERINEIVSFLLRVGLVSQKKDGSLETGAARLHLGVDSPHLPKHHANWNLFTLQKLLTDHKRDLHFSSVVSLSAKDIRKVRETYTRALEEANAIIKDSEGEKIFALTLNFTEVC